MRTEDPSQPEPSSPAGKLRQNTTGGAEPREQRQRLTDDPAAPRGQEPAAVVQGSGRVSPLSLVQLPPGATFGRSDPLTPEERERLAAYAARALAEMEGEADRRAVPTDAEEREEGP